MSSTIKKKCIECKNTASKKCIECKNTASQKCIFLKCKPCCSLINDQLCAFHYIKPQPIFVKVGDVKSILENLQIFHKDLDNIIIDYYDEDGIFCSRCMEKDDNHSPIYTYTCNHCDIFMCDKCGGYNELFIMCKEKDCYYCKRGHCYNNKIIHYCSTCYLKLDLKSESDSEI